MSKVVSYFCEVSLHQDISRFWEIEETTERTKDGRYVVSLPFKEGFPLKINLGYSRNTAMGQFLRNEARLIRTPNLKPEYDNVLEEYIALGHMSKISHLIAENPSNHYYLPHHAVIKSESTTTRVRVVFNASSPSSNG